MVALALVAAFVAITEVAGPPTRAAAVRVVPVLAPPIKTVAAEVAGQW